jgi:O-antigen/teichoic acid export membrane protein
MKTDRENCGAADNVERRGALAFAIARILHVMRRSPRVSTGLLSIFDQAVVSGTSFLTAALIGRTTSQDQLGLYYVALSIVLIASGVLDQLVASPYAVYSKRRHGCDLDEYSGSMWAHHFAWTLIAIGGLLLAIFFGWAAGDISTRPVLWALLGAGPLMLLRDGIRRFAFANLRMSSVILFDVIVAIAQLGGLALLARWGRLSLLNIYLMMGAACGLAAMIWYLLDPPRVRFARERFLPDWRHNWKFAKWALRSFLVGSTTPQIMLWIVSMTVGAAATGVLGASTTITGVANVLLLGVANVLTPQAAHAYASGGPLELRRVLCLAAAVMFVPLSVFCLVVMVTGDWLMVLVFGTLYQGSGQTLFTLALSTLMVSMGTVAGNGLWAIDQPKLNFLADVCAMGITIIAAVVLVPELGALGAALAMLVGTLAAAVVRAITLLRCLGVGSADRNTEAASALSL